MIRSMTAYGRSQTHTPRGEWTLELHAVNRKGLEVAVALPKEFICFDPPLRKKVAEKIHRGQITVRLYFVPAGATPSIEALASLKQQWEAVATALGTPCDEITLAFLLEQLKGGVELPSQGDPEVQRLLEELFEEALAPFLQMRRAEGEALAQDIEKRLGEIDGWLTAIEALLPRVEASARLKFEERCKDLSLKEDRLYQELALLIQKSDVTEEAVRLKSHLQQAQALLSSEGSVGRPLDFLAQEMGREITTLLTKSSDREVEEKGFAIKVAIEKFREQVQNVE